MKTHVGIVKNRREDPIKANETKEGMNLSPPRHNERIIRPSDLCPIERENAQPQPIINPKDLVNNHIIRSDPTDPIEDRQRGEQVS